jgi:hypothetical protein
MIFTTAKSQWQRDMQVDQFADLRVVKEGERAAPIAQDISNTAKG